MKFVGYMLFVLILIMCRPMLMRGKICGKCFILIMAMSLAYVPPSILLAMLVLTLWISF
jgi:hypothetical protein